MLFLMNIPRAQVSSEQLRIPILSKESFQTIQDSLRPANLWEMYELDSLSGYQRLYGIYQSTTQDIRIDTVAVISATGDLFLPAVAQRIFVPMFGPIAGKNIDRTWQTLLQLHPYLGATSGYRLGKRNQPGSQLGLLAMIQPDFENYLSGLVGANRQSSGKLDLTGEFTLHIENPWRTASVFHLDWRRLNALTQIVHILYDEPFPFGLPVGFSLEYDQELRDDQYVKTVSGIGITTSTFHYGNWRIGHHRSQVSPTPLGDSLGIRESKEQILSLRYSYERRDRRWLPKTKQYFNIEGGIGQVRERGQEYLQSHEALQFDGIFPVRNRSGIRLNTRWRGIDRRGAPVHPADQIRFGGLTTLRGYYDDIFKSDRVFLTSLEWLFYPSSVTRFSLFIDLSAGTGISPQPYSTGIGFEQIGSAGILRIFFGVGRSNTISEGKLHIQFVNRIKNS